MTVCKAIDYFFKGLFSRGIRAEYCGFLERESYHYQKCYRELDRVISSILYSGKTAEQVKEDLLKSRQYCEEQLRGLW
jgi:hypothetical protein